jgi:hypothetical protein
LLSVDLAIAQIASGADSIRAQLYDYGLYQIRQALAPIPGITLPTELRRRR